MVHSIYILQKIFELDFFGKGLLNHYSMLIVRNNSLHIFLCCLFFLLNWSLIGRLIRCRFFIRTICVFVRSCENFLSNLLGSQFILHNSIVFVAAVVSWIKSFENIVFNDLHLVKVHQNRFLEDLVLVMIAVKNDACLRWYQPSMCCFHLIMISLL